MATTTGSFAVTATEVFTLNSWGLQRVDLALGLAPPIVQSLGGYQACLQGARDLAGHALHVGDDATQQDPSALDLAGHGGLANANHVQDHGFMYGRDLVDPDGHLWGTFWMDACAAQPVT